MPIVGNVAVQFEDNSGRAVRIFPDLEAERPARSNTISRLILETPGEPFRLAISSPTCDRRWVRVLVEEKLVFEGQIFACGEIDGRPVLGVVKGLHHRGRSEALVPSSPRSSASGVRGADIVVEFDAVSTNDDSRHVLQCIFKPRSLSELQELFPQTGLYDLTSTSPSIANEPEPSTEPSSPPPLFTTTTNLYPSQQGEQEAETLHCCTLNLYGAAPDPRRGEIAHTGIINCDNEWCQAPGQAWHKSCAGLEIWEDPKELWICPRCRTMPWEQMEILEGRLDDADEGLIKLCE
ncbi:hypothetical protein BST61_g3915 [Cercospora zeina]